MRFEKEISIFAKNAILKRFQASETNFSVIQGKISAIISESEIAELQNGNITMYDKLGEVEQTAGGIRTKFEEFQTEYSKAQEEYTKFEKSTSEYIQNSSVFKTTVTNYMNDTNDKVENIKSVASQTADKITWLVESGESKTDFTLTDRVAELVTESLVIKNKDGSKTIVSGGRMDIEEIFAQDITATGTIKGVTLIGAEIGAKRIIATKEFSLSNNSDADVERVLYYDGNTVRVGKLLNAAGAQSGAGFEFVGATTITAYGNLNMYSGGITSPGTIQGKSIKATADLSGTTIKSLGEIIANSNVKSGDNFLLDNAHGIYGKDINGNYRDMITLSAGNNTTLGFGLYNIATGSTRIYGNKLAFITKMPAKEWAPYYSPGDSITINFEGAGFITTNRTEVRFTIPISRPIFSNAASVGSVNGMIVRQNGKYCYGSTASAWAKPLSYTADVCENFVIVKAKFGNTANVSMNNAACGVAASIKITF